MRFLLFFIIFSLVTFVPSLVIAAEHDSRVDFSYAQTTVVENATSVCTGASKVRYDFTYGQVKAVINATATCTAAVASPAVPGRVIILGTTIINGTVITPP